MYFLKVHNQRGYYGKQESITAYRYRNKESSTKRERVVRAHPIWPPRAFAFGQLTHQHLATARMLYLAS